jgi:ribosomal protein L40E
MATKIPVAQARLFANVFVCRDCNHKMRTQAVRVIARKVRCIKCGSNILRPVRKK